MKKLRIAQIAPFWFDVPPKVYGGSERIVSYITEELVRRGHQVTLFASEESKTSARLVSPVKSELLKTIEYYCDPNFNAVNTYVNAQVFKQAANFDIIHSHASYFSFYFCDLTPTPVVHTIHNQLPREREAENNLFRQYKHLNFVSVSDEFRTHFDRLNYVATVYHGLPTEQFSFSDRGGSNLFWIGRASKNKGELQAIEAATKTKKKLNLALSLRPDTTDYFNNYIAPKLNTDITTIKNVKFEDTPKLYQQAKALLYPIEWKEPFGLIFIESLSSGTPVIAYARGSTPEIIKDGQTGFLVNPSDDEKTGDWAIKKTGMDGLCEAIQRIYAMSHDEYLKMRQACRRHVEENFTTKTMVDHYEKVYYSLLS